ncbi:MAG: GxxExxY protein [Thiohalobacteraceae bacterium]
MEPSSELDALAHKVIGAAIEVHRILGPGYLESVYEEALAIELSIQGIGCDRQTPINIEYKGKAVGDGRLDLLVAGRLVVELKTVDHLLPIHHAQVLSYLKATRKRIGLLINFNVRVLRDGIKRVVFSP